MMEGLLSRPGFGSLWDHICWRPLNLCHGECYHMHRRNPVATSIRWTVYSQQLEGHYVSFAGWLPSRASAFTRALCLSCTLAFTAAAQDSSKDCKLVLGDNWDKWNQWDTRSTRRASRS